MAYYDFAKTVAADREREFLASAAVARARRASHPSVAGRSSVRTKLRSWFRTDKTAALSSPASPRPAAVSALDVPADRTSAGTRGEGQAA